MATNATAIYQRGKRRWGLPAEQTPLRSISGENAVGAYQRSKRHCDLSAGQTPLPPISGANAIAAYQRGKPKSQFTPQRPTDRTPDQKDPLNGPNPKQGDRVNVRLDAEDRRLRRSIIDDDRDLRDLD